MPFSCLCRFVCKKLYWKETTAVPVSIIEIDTFQPCTNLTIYYIFVEVQHKAGLVWPNDLDCCAVGPSWIFIPILYIESCGTLIDTKEVLFLNVSFMSFVVCCVGYHLNLCVELLLQVVRALSCPWVSHTSALRDLFFPISYQVKCLPFILSVTCHPVYTEYFDSHFYIWLQVNVISWRYV